MKSTLAVALLFIFNFFYSQSVFEFERSWGTYFGANGGQIAGIHTTKGILFDSQQNLHVRGSMWNQQNMTGSYFNQFLLGGGSSWGNQQNDIYGFDANLSSSGMLSYYGYLNALDSKSLEKVDQQDNKYYLFFGSPPSVQTTAGVYLPNDPQPSSTHKVILAKYSSAGVLIWASYLPSISRAINLELDEAGNVYVSGETQMLQNISNPGVLQENYDIIYDSAGQLIPSGYLMKLSPSGQKIWGTYMPTGLSISMQYFNGALYMLTGMNTNSALSTMATSGAFQTSPSNNSITKMNTSDGTRMWGTYYGGAPSVGFAMFTDLAVNETGLYVTGTDYNFDGSSFFGTPASFKQNVTGGSDIFLSKFSLSGNREWSTYFGSSGEDMNEFDKVIALDGNQIYITGTTFGGGNNIATPNSYQSAPESNSVGSHNFYFAKFNASGSLSWASYYGGSSAAAGIAIPINVAFKNNTLYLFGSTNSNTGYTTEGAWMPTRNPSITNGLTCFMAKFNKTTLAVNETKKENELMLYNNPNNGNFTLEGIVLAKKNCTMKIHDASGRLIDTKKLSNQKKQMFEMQSILQKGNYILEISDGTILIKSFKMIVK